MDGIDGTKKYNNASFKDLLLDIASKPLDAQLDDIDQEFLGWKGNHDQLDDILVIGLKV